MATIKQMFIDEIFYTGADGWNTAFASKFSELTQPQKERYFSLASRRIKRLANTLFDNLADLEPFEQMGVKEATSILVDYWVEYGLNLNRTSGSISTNGFSVSENPPADPDYIPEAVYEALAEVGLYEYSAMAIDDCNEEEYPDNYEWNGLNYPFKFSFTVNSSTDLPTSNIKFRTYAYTTDNQHWYVWDGLKWEDLGLFTIKGEPGKQGVKGDKGDGIDWLTDNYANVAEFSNNAKNYEMVRYNLNKDGSNNVDGIVLLVKVGSEVKEFRTWEEIKAYVDKEDVRLAKLLDTNISTTDTIATRLLYAEGDIADLKANGVTIPHLEITTPLSDAEIDTRLKAMISSPVDKEIAYVGSNQAWVIWKYSTANTKWSKTDRGSGHSTSGSDASKANKDLSNTALKTSGMVAIGKDAGHNSQSAYAVAIGDSAGNIGQGGATVAIGKDAGNNGQGDFSIAIGYGAGLDNQATKSIVMNASDAPVNLITPNTILMTAGNITIKITANGMYANGKRVVDFTRSIS